jgi:hypothetical protein
MADGFQCRRCIENFNFVVRFTGEVSSASYTKIRFVEVLRSSRHTIGTADAKTQLQNRHLFAVCLSYPTYVYFTTNVVFEFIVLSLKNGGRWKNLVTIFGFGNVKSIRITHLFYREEFDADQFRF